jgi:hypothetical protein
MRRTVSAISKRVVKEYSSYDFSMTVLANGARLKSIDGANKKSYSIQYVGIPDCCIKKGQRMGNVVEEYSATETNEEKIMYLAI